LLFGVLLVHDRENVSHWSQVSLKSLYVITLYSDTGKATCVAKEHIHGVVRGATGIDSRE